MGELQTSQGSQRSDERDGEQNGSTMQSQGAQAGGQEGQSKTPGLADKPAKQEEAASPWSPSPSPGGGQTQAPRGCATVLVLVLVNSALSMLLGVKVLSHLL